MSGAGLASFLHPRGAYSLRYPAHWECLVQEGGRSCGFGPRERDDVGLWISILPASVDSEHAEMRAGLRRIFAQASGKDSLVNIREDPSLKHFGLKADSARPGEAGHYWLVLGGDAVLFASTQVPASAREEYDGLFDEVMASLRVHRDEDLRKVQLANELLRRLQERYPEAGYGYDPDSELLAIRGREGQVLYPGNLYRRVREAPGRRAELIEEFVSRIPFIGDDAPSHETLDAVRELIVPVVKPVDYVRQDGPTAAVVHRAWLGGVAICYAVQGRSTLSFVLEKDLARWETPAGELHRLAMGNLERKSFPESLAARRPTVEPVILLTSGDGNDASRILHPRLHQVVSPVLGSHFLAGIPDRSTLVLFSRAESRVLARLRAQVRKDFDRAAYPVSPALFLVAPEGIRPFEG